LFSGVPFAQSHRRAPIDLQLSEELIADSGLSLKIASLMVLGFRKESNAFKTNVLIRLYVIGDFLAYLFLQSRKLSDYYTVKEQ